MRELKFRTLTADDVECRVCSTTDKRINLLIYKNARVDMNILNSTVGMGWQRSHSFKDGKNYCTVSIWDDETKMWISREDCGTESNTEAEKGQSSDAFKRACFNWGIGIELYTTPKISIEKTDKDVWNDKVTMTFKVSEMTVDESHKITHIAIVDKFGNKRYEWDSNKATVPVKLVQNNPPKDNITLLTEFCSAQKESAKNNKEINKLLDFYNYWRGKIDKGEFRGTINPEKLWNNLKKLSA